MHNYIYSHKYNGYTHTSTMYKHTYIITHTHICTIYIYSHMYNVHTYIIACIHTCTMYINT